MKKVISLCLAVILLFSFSACSKKVKTSDGDNYLIISFQAKDLTEKQVEKFIKKNHVSVRRTSLKGKTASDDLEYKLLDDDGEAALLFTVDKGIYTVEVSADGYKTVTKRIEVNDEPVNCMTIEVEKAEAG